ncbi:MAG: hypothetical protein HFJ40_03175 [Clostridia bacterium]|nr:hypothetical protein [Clostridia bacterium]
MAPIRDEQLERKIQERLDRLGISGLTDQKEGISYLSKVIYEFVSNECIKDVAEAQEKIAKMEEVPLYELQTDIATVVSMADEEVLKSFHKAEDYNLRLVWDTIELIADDILMD